MMERLPAIQLAGSSRITMLVPRTSTSSRYSRYLLHRIRPITGRESSSCSAASSSQEVFSRRIVLGVRSVDDERLENVFRTSNMGTTAAHATVF